MLPLKIVHLASIASAVDARYNPGLMFDLQLVSLRNILELMRSTKPIILNKLCCCHQAQFMETLRKML